MSRLSDRSAGGILGIALVACAAPPVVSNARGLAALETADFTDVRQAAADRSILVRADPRVELFSILARLAGFDEYSRAPDYAYTRAVDLHFAAFADHDAVQRLRSQRRWHGIAHDAVMNLAVHVTDPPELAELMPFDPRPASLDRRWNVRSARSLLDAARRFAIESDFQAFWESQRELLGESQARFSGVLEDADLLAWFDAFFGIPAELWFFAAPGMLTGGSSYGATARDGQVVLIHQIIGVLRLDERGLPRFDVDTLPTIVHEYCHAFVNPLVERCAGDLEAPAKKIFAQVEDEMESQAYGNWKVMVCESLVRAATAQFLELHRGPEVARKDIRYNQFTCSFLWVDELYALLEEYERDRERYPILDAFMPRVAAWLDDYAGRVGPIVAERERRLAYWQARAPGVSPELERAVDEGLERSARLIDAALASCGREPESLRGCLREVLNKLSFEHDIQVTVLDARGEFAYHVMDLRGSAYQHRDVRGKLVYRELNESGEDRGKIFNFDYLSDDRARARANVIAFERRKDLGWLVCVEGHQWQTADGAPHERTP